MIVLAGCYRSHEPGDALDGGGTCGDGLPLEIRVEPALPTGHYDEVRFARMEADPSVDGVRFQIDTCTGSCPHEVQLVGIGADVVERIGVPAGWQGTGSVEWSGASLHVVAQDLRRCAPCGGELELVAGALDPESLADIHPGTVTCAACPHHRSVVAERDGARVEAARGQTAQDGPLVLRVTSDSETCAGCSCTLPDIPATGLFVFSRLPP